MSSSEKGLLEKGSLQKSPFSRDSREVRDSRDSREPSDCGNKGIRLFSRDLENLDSAITTIACHDVLAASYKAALWWWNGRAAYQSCFRAGPTKHSHNHDSLEKFSIKSAFGSASDEHMSVFSVFHCEEGHLMQHPGAPQN